MIRLARGLTQQDVYEPAGIAKSYCSALENRKRGLNERLILRL
ncbi:helix-turn-helix domain-containing protein [Leisingera sp. D0M16]